MGTTKKDQRKAKKAKKRQERIRQEKHARAYGGGMNDRLANPYDSSLDVDDEEHEPDERDVDFTLERAQRTIAWASSHRVFSTRADLERFIATDMARDTWMRQHEQMLAGEVAERAQELAFQALESDSEHAADGLARQALDLDPDCLDAARIAVSAKPVEEQYQHLHQMLLRYVERPSVAAALVECDGMAWPRVRSRPYIRTVMGLADLAERCSDFAAASDWADRLRALAHDHYIHQRYRDRHLGWLLAQGQHAAARALLDRDLDRQDAVWLWGRALERFLADDLLGARIAVEEARQHVGEGFESLVLDGPGESISPADALLFATIGHVWRRNLDAGDWLESGCCLTTVAEQAQAKQGYRAPVSTLLSLGQPKAVRDAIAQMTQGANLTLFDVPELLRMADDQALHELPGDDPAVYASVHAIHAIAHLHPPAALPGLIGLLPRRITDDWMEGGLAQAFSAIGHPAIAPLRAILTDPSRRPSERSFAADTLSQLARKHPDTSDDVLGILVHALRNHQNQAKSVNGSLAWSLSQLRPTDTADLIKAVYDAGRMDEEMYGSWEVFRQELTRAFDA